MTRAYLRLAAVAAAPFVLVGCVGHMNREVASHSLIKELDVPQDPCPESGAGARIQLGVADVPPPALTQMDFDAGMAMLSQRKFLALADHVVPSAEALLLQFVGSAMVELAEDQPFLSFSSIRHVQEVEEGAIASTQRQASAAVAGDVQRVELPRKGWRASLDALWNATASHGWGSATVASLGQLERSRLTGLAPSGATAASQNSIMYGLARHALYYLYFKAYFRNGKILSATMTSDVLRSALKEKLKQTIKDETLLKAVETDIDSVADELVSAMCKEDEGDCLALGVIGKTTFTTRGGKSYSFPGITASFDPFGDDLVSTNKIDKEVVISDLVRVFFEATGDIVAGVPAVESSTACKSNYLCAAEADAEKLAKVETVADKVEAGATALTGVAIRGGWLFSLNNEALAKAIQTGVATSFRKGAEKAAWSILNRTCAPATPRPLYNRVTIALVE